MAPIQLREGMQKYGNMTIKKSVLGKTQFAEALVDWSIKTKEGASFKKETVWGLELEFFANKTEPFVMVVLKEEKLAKFLENFQATTIIQLEEYGFGFLYPAEGEEKLVEAKKGSEINGYIYIDSDANPKKIYIYNHKNKKEVRFLGKIDLKEKGFFWTMSDELIKSITYLVDTPEEESVNEEDTQEVTYEEEEIANAILQQLAY